MAGLQVALRHVRLSAVGRDVIEVEDEVRVDHAARRNRRVERTEDPGRVRQRGGQIDLARAGYIEIASERCRRERQAGGARVRVDPCQRIRNVCLAAGRCGPSNRAVGVQTERGRLGAGGPVAVQAPWAARHLVAHHLGGRHRQVHCRWVAL